MNKKKVIKLIFLIAIILTIFMAFFALTLSIKAASPYNTYTPNRYGKLTTTQDAYEPFSSIKIQYNGLEINDAQDMVFDEHDNLFIVDSGNKRGLILDKTMNVIKSFGDADNLSYPRGIYVIKAEDTNKEYIYITDYNQDSGVGKVVRYIYDLNSKAVSKDKEMLTPSSWILETDGYKYKPIKIAVSDNYYMYVTAEGSTSGVLMINDKNEFITYFASNSAKFSFIERIEYFFYGDNEKANLVKKIAAAPFNVMLDGSGYVYTITQSTIEADNESDNFKKVNTGGVNYFPNEMWGAKNFTDSYYGKYSNTYALTEDGSIYEYDNEGNLLFKFGGYGYGKDLYGLFSSTSSIALDSKDYIYVIDDTRNNLQVFKPTLYCDLVHQALKLYTEAKYEEAKELWNEVLRYNSMFDLAHKGMGLAYYMEGNYKEALKEFYIANDKVNYSDAYWEIRNLYLIDNLSIYILIALIVVLSITTLVLTNRKYKYLEVVKYPFKKAMEVKLINQTLYSFRFIRHPEDSVYETRKNNRSTILSSSIILLILFIEYLLGLVYTGFIFNNTIIEETILLREGVKIILPIILFIIANYLMSSLMEGEGRFKDIFVSTVGALTPIIIIYPIVILISNVLTNQEAFLYSFLIVVMFIWAGLLLFMNIKNTHNYSVAQTFVNLLLTIFMLVILILVILVVYVMVYQVYSFIADIVKEVIINA